LKNKKGLLISIILPVFNGENYLSQSIESCINQTYENIELIIIDDCSTDHTPEIIRKYALKDGRIRMFRNEKNLKLPKSLNIGHYKAKGRYMTWTSHDNLYHPEAIQKMFCALNHNFVDFVYGNMTIINSQEEHLRPVHNAPIEDIIFNNPIGGCFLYSRKVFEKLSGFNENLFLVEDYDFWLRTTRYFKIFHLNEKLYFFRHHENSLSSSRKVDEARKSLFSENLELMYGNFLKSISHRNSKKMAIILTDNILRRNNNFINIKSNIKDFNEVILRMKKHKAFNNHKKLRKYLMLYVIKKLWEDARTNGFNMSYVFFVILEFNFFLGKSQVNSLVAYSLAKFKMYSPKF